ncbi:E3 SUMO-protein ligase pli1 [Paraconiothyrium brasiliense]|uniref:E3 SUMO-protein ligase pli1 n=1 Tax=Paraconiothyrium brasiliense TaxID=300254 RepID=A0ABR3RVU8_9PLEO
MASSSLGQMSPTLIQRSKTLLNKDLQRICRAEGVATSGVKSQLQGRVTDCPQYFFKESPFFEIRDMLLNNITLDKVRVNQDEVKANYKGLKNKPGSTRPADITDLLRITPANYRNSIGITYALTQKASDHQKYNVFIYMVRKFSVNELVKQIQNRSVITKDSVLREMRKKADDPDIEVGSSVMSLKDPISTLKINTPCRSTVCSHNRCFDGESFLQLQEQAPTWTCPICNKIISFQSLAVDEYVQDILSNVSRSTDQVTVEPDGQWRSEKEPPATNRKSNGSAYGYNYDEEDDSEEELVEIPDYRLSAIKSEAAPTPQSLQSIRTPPAPSREASSAPRTGSKRSSEVIDLTLSDDDEPRPKKVAYSTPNSAPDRMRQYQLPSYSSMHSRPDGVRMDPPLAQTRHSYGTYREPQAHSNTSYPGQGTSAYPAYIDSSP